MDQWAWEQKVITDRVRDSSVTKIDKQDVKSWSREQEHLSVFAQRPDKKKTREFHHQTNSFSILRRCSCTQCDTETKTSARSIFSSLVSLRFVRELQSESTSTVRRRDRGVLTKAGNNIVRIGEACSLRSIRRQNIARDVLTKKRCQCNREQGSFASNEHNEIRKSGAAKAERRLKKKSLRN